ncbi:MAG TPA: NADH-quinone oxidoreductase subunit C [Acidimicrobiales bacterium]|nr:NADH-quinone oxidoreductase subunit C [Acidimicrobiales bacterium]
MSDGQSDVAPDEEAQGEGVPEPETRHGALVTRTFGDEVLHVERERWLEVVEALRDEGYTLCTDITAVDYLTHTGRTLPAGVAPERFEVVANLVSLEQRARLRLRTQVPEGDPTVASLWGVHPGTEAGEREVYDMFGIAFDGHPDMTRILMPEDWEGHPLRKDYAVGEIPVAFKGTPGVR